MTHAIGRWLCKLVDTDNIGCSSPCRFTHWSGSLSYFPCAVWIMIASFRSFGSRQIRSLPSGFSTTINEFTHSVGSVTFVMTFVLTSLSSSSFSRSFSAWGTRRGEWIVGVAPSLRWIVVSPLISPRPVKRWLYS